MLRAVHAVRAAAGADQDASDGASSSRGSVDCSNIRWAMPHAMQEQYERCVGGTWDWWDLVHDCFPN